MKKESDEGKKVPEDEKKFVKGIVYDLVNGITYDLSRGITYDSDPEEKLDKNGNSDLPEEALPNVCDTKEEDEEKDSGLVKDVERPLKRGIYYLEKEENLNNPCTAVSVQKDQKCGLNSLEKNSLSEVKKVPIQNNLQEMNTFIPASSLNFELHLLTRIIRVFDTENGEKRNFSYRVKVSVYTMNGGIKSFECEVPGDKIKGIEWLKKATNSLATIPKGKEQQEEYNMGVQMCIETEGIPEEIIYERGGWRNIPHVGWRYVYSQGMIGDPNGLVHTRDRSRYRLDFWDNKMDFKKIFDLAMGMRNICRNAMASTELFIYVHASLLTELFKIAGHPLNFVFGVVGVTNSRKTSLVTAMAKIFNRSNLVADAEFATASECGIEKMLSIYKDAPVIIDDFKPGINQAQQSVLNQKLDNLLRLYRNRVPKKRMMDFTPDGDKKYFPIEGGCVLTLELVDGVLSSMTRLFLTEIGVNEVQNDRLDFYQQNRWILSMHIYDFLDWVTNQFEKSVGFIKKNFTEFRDAHPFSMARFSDSYATLMVTAGILSLYALERYYWSKIQCQEFVSDAEKIVLEELEIMESRIQNVDKGLYALRIFNEYLNNGKIQAVSLNETTCKNRCRLYENEEFFFVQSEYLRMIVNEHSRNCGDRINIINNDEIIGHLERLKVLDILEKDGRSEKSRKLPIQRGNTLRYLYIIKLKMKKMLEV